jgi:hypothetical protein
MAGCPRVHTVWRSQKCLAGRTGYNEEKGITERKKKERKYLMEKKKLYEK